MGTASKSFTLKAETRERTKQSHQQHIHQQEQWSLVGRRTRVLVFGHSHVERLLRTENSVNLPDDWFISGIGGDRFCHALWRLRKDNFLDKFDPKPESCVLWIGNNDIGMMSPHKFGPSWTMLIRMLQERVGAVYAVSLVPGSAMSADDISVRVQLNDTLKTVCEATGAHYIDMMGVGDAPEDVYCDGTHFNAQGYSAIMRILMANVAY